MNRKFLLGSAIAAALMFGANFATACSITAWSSATGLTGADTGEPPAGFQRASGRCGLRIQNLSTPRFLTDTTPANEKNIRIRFYYLTGDHTATTPVSIFQARNTGGTNIIEITHNGSVLSFTTNTGGAAQTVTVADNRQYSIEMTWAAGTVSPATNGSMTATVTGNSGQSATAAVAGTVNFPSLANSADGIDETRLGFIAGTTTVASPVFFDEYDSRRTTNPGRLCRGDVNNSGSITAGDRSAITNELAIPSVVAVGQADCNESTSTTASDRSCVTNLLAAFATCN